MQRILRRIQCNNRQRGANKCRCQNNDWTRLLALLVCCEQSAARTPNKGCAQCNGLLRSDGIRSKFRGVMCREFWNSMQQSAAWCEQVPVSIKLIEPDYYLFGYIASERPIVCGSKWLHRTPVKILRTKHTQNTILLKWEASEFQFDLR